MNSNASVDGTRHSAVWLSATRLRAGTIVRHALDTVIALEFAAVAVVAITGGGSLGWLGARNVAKPVLLLLIALPIRLALGERTWLAALGGWIWLRVRTAVVPVLAWLDARPAIRDSAYALGATRVASLVVGFFAAVLVPLSRDKQFDLPFQWESLARVFAAWDSGWYFDIARRGYYYSADAQSSIAFFPLYPLLVRVASWPFGGGERAIWLAAIVLTFAETFVALVLVHRLTERLFGTREVARRTVLYICVFPFSLFLTRVYAESTFLLFSVLAISEAYASRWWTSGLAGGLAALARPNGILIAVPIVLLALRDRPPLTVLARRGVALSLVPGALGLFCVYVWMLSGDPLAWLAAQEQWGFSLGHPPWQQLLKMLDRFEEHGLYGYFFVTELAPYRVLHGMATLFVLALTPFVFARLGGALGLYVLASLLVPLTGNALEGVGRYSAVLFPAFMALAVVSRDRWHEIVLIVSSMLFALLVVLFVTLHPIY